MVDGRGANVAFLEQLHVRRLIFAALIFVGAVAGCAAPTDLSAISKYATTTAQSADSFAALAADYLASCQRYHAIFQGIIETSAAPQTASFVTTNPQLEAFLLPRESPQPGYTTPPGIPVPQPMASGSLGPQPAGSDSCADPRTISLAWREANAAVLGYVQALGSLAGVDAAPTPNPSPLVAGLAAVGVSSAATSAISDLIVKIGSYFELRARDREINTFLAAVNPYMPVAIGALEQTDASYTILLESEYNLAIAKYNGYARIEMQSLSSKNGAQTARQLLRTRSTVEAYLASVNQKLRASADYGQAVETILTTHQQLYEASQSSASFADYLKVIQTTGEPVVTDLLDLAKAVK